MASVRGGSPQIPVCPTPFQFVPPPHLLKDVAVELLLAIAEELADHLPAQALPLQDEVGHPHGGVREEAPLDQILDPLLWFPTKVMGARSPRLPWGSSFRVGYRVT